LGIRERFKRGAEREYMMKGGWYILWGLVARNKDKKSDENHAHAVDGLCRDVWQHWTNRGKRDREI
jgi:hypothetical protein